MSPRSWSSACRRLLFLVSSSVVALLLLAPVASASTATRSSNALTYTATSGEVNAIFVSDDGAGTFTIEDDGVTSIDISGAANGSYPDVSAEYIVECKGLTSL